MKVKHYKGLDLSGSAMKRIFENFGNEIHSGGDRERMYNLVRYKLYRMQCEDENELNTKIGQVIQLKKEKGLDLRSAIQVLAQQVR